jgi:hypothetical protein
MAPELAQEFYRKRTHMKLAGNGEGFYVPMRDEFNSGKCDFGKMKTGMEARRLLHAR